MLSVLKRAGERFALLAATLTLGACIITAPGTYFSADDFVVPKVLTGDWITDGEDAESDDVTRLRLAPFPGNLYRAVPLTEKRAVNTDEEPVDFGLVALGPGKYILVTTEEDGDSVKSEFLGMTAQEDELVVYLFGGGDSKAGEAAFDAALAQAGLKRDPDYKYEVHLADPVTKENIVALFRTLMAAPATYEPNVTVYKRIR